MPEPITATETEVQPEPPTVQFDDTQKARINALIADASRRAGSEARAEAKKLKDELDALRRTQTPAPGEDVTLELATTRAELQALKTAQADAAMKNSLLAAASDQNFFDARLAVDLLRQNAKLIDGKVVFFDSEGNARLGADFSALTPVEAARQLAAERPYLCRGTVRGGAGSHAADRVPTAQPKLEDLFGPKSDGGAANRLAMHSPELYRDLKRRAVAKGLLR